MKLAIVYSRASVGVHAPLVSVEAHISPGLPGLSIVGLPEAVVKESKDRVRSAIINSQLNFPARKIIINLAPADLPKEGGRFDLPIALGILAASGQIPCPLETYEFAGELALSGELRRFHGALPFALESRKAHHALFLPIQNAEEAAIPGDNTIYPAKSLSEICDYLCVNKPLKPYILSYSDSHQQGTDNLPDIRDIQGQPHAKRALEIAAAGKHSLLLVGPPGTGKTMLASRLPSIMPKLTNEEALEVCAVYSLGQKNIITPKWRERPFRSPHHTASAAALVGGGSQPKPGEISFAHHGVLFLDELPEFDRKVLEVLREPLEAGSIIISRANRQAEFPAQFQLIAAMNPCPCGQLGNPTGQCNCTHEQIQRYQTRISSPLLDRIDMHIEVPMLPPTLLMQKQECSIDSSEQIRQKVETAIDRQRQRSKKLNADLTNSEVKEVCQLTPQSQKMLNKAIEQFGFSARSYYRILKVARTISDLSGKKDIQGEALSEALSFRRLTYIR